MQEFIASLKSPLFAIMLAVLLAGAAWIFSAGVSIEQYRQNVEDVNELIVSVKADIEASDNQIRDAIQQGFENRTITNAQLSLLESRLESLEASIALHCE